MRHRFVTLLLAVAATLAVGLIASLPALASGGGMMGTPTPSPTLGIPSSAAPWPAPTSVDGARCAGGFWSGNGMWGGMMGGGMMSGGTRWGTGYGTDWLMSHPAGFTAWRTQRARQMSQMRGWWAKYRTHPSGTAAKRALASMRAHHNSACSSSSFLQPRLQK